MSYLRNFKGVPNHMDPAAGSVVASSISDPDLEAKFTHLRLNGISAQAVINSISGHVQALNLSHNRIEQLPRSLPAKVVGLNLSFNILTNLRGSKGLLNLIELNVSNNNLTSLFDISQCIGLQYLDISNNHLTEIVGLESLINLKMLKCEGNLIQQTSGFRTLSFNTQLVSLNVAHNPVAEFSYQDVRVYIHNILPGLKTLDGQPIRSNQIGYTENVQPVMKRNSPGNFTPAPPTTAAAADQQVPVSAMSSPTWSGGVMSSFARTPVAQDPKQQQQQQRPTDMSSSYYDQFHAYPNNHQQSRHQSNQGYENIQNIEPNIRNVSIVNQEKSMYSQQQPLTEEDPQQQQEEIEEAYQELLENRFVANSRLPWRNPPNPLPREFAARPWLTDSITSRKKEEYDRTKSPINYFLQLRQRSDSQDVSSVASVPPNSLANQSIRQSMLGHDDAADKSLHQYYENNISTLSVCHPDIPVQHHPRPRDLAQLPLLPTEISTLQVDGRTSFANDTVPADNNNTTINTLNVTTNLNRTAISSANSANGANASTLMARTQQSFSYSNHKAPATLRSYTKAYQKTMQTFEKNRSKNPKLLPHQQPYDGVYPSPVMTPLHNQYPGFHTLRGHEDDADMYAGLEDNMNMQPQGQLNFGPDVSPLSGPYPQQQQNLTSASQAAATVSWMAPSLRSTTGAATAPGDASPPGLSPFPNAVLNSGAGNNSTTESQSNVPVWDILDVAKRWDIHQHATPMGTRDSRGRTRSRSPHPTSFTPDSLLYQSHSSHLHNSNLHLHSSRSRSHSPTKASVLRAEFIRSQQAEQEQMKILEDNPPRKPRFADTYVPNQGGSDEVARGRSRSISRSRIRRSNLENVMDGSRSPTASSSRSNSQTRAQGKRPASRSKSPYQNLLDLKARIRNLLDHEKEYFEAKQQQLESQKQDNLPPPPQSRVFDFLRNEMASLTAEHKHLETQENKNYDNSDQLNVSFASQRSAKSTGSNNSLVMMPTLASRNFLRHPENVVKSSTALTPATKAGLANHDNSNNSQKRLKTGTLVKTNVPMKPSGIVSVREKPVQKRTNATAAAKRAVSPAHLPRSKESGSNSGRKASPRRSTSASRERKSKQQAVDEEMAFLKRMNEYLQLFESAASNFASPSTADASSPDTSAMNMEQMMGAGFALYEQLVRKRTQLMQDMRETSPSKYSTIPGMATFTVTSPVAHRRSSRLARESEHVLRALQKYMLDILAIQEKNGGNTGKLNIDPNLLTKLRSLTPNKYQQNNNRLSSSREFDTSIKTSSKIDNELSKQILAEEMKSITNIMNNLKNNQLRQRSPSPSPRPSVPQTQQSFPESPPPPPPPTATTTTDANNNTNNLLQPQLQQPPQRPQIESSSLAASSPVSPTPTSPRPSKIPLPLQRTNSNRTISSATTSATFSTSNTTTRPSGVLKDIKTNNEEDEEDIVVDAQGKVTMQQQQISRPQQDIRHLANSLLPSTSSNNMTASFLSPVAPVDEQKSQMQQSHYFSFEQSTFSQPPVPTPPPAAPTSDTSSNNATVSMQAMAIGSLIAQLTARQKESLQSLQQQLQQTTPAAQPSPAHSVNSQFSNYSYLSVPSSQASMHMPASSSSRLM